MSKVKELVEAMQKKIKEENELKLTQLKVIISINFIETWEKTCLKIKGWLKEIFRNNIAILSWEEKLRQNIWE